jgi:phosphodiesterase/alkaline phosphatase D-like protein
VAHQFFLIFKGVACVVSNLSAPLPNPKETSLHRSKLRGAGAVGMRVASHPPQSGRVEGRTSYRNRYALYHTDPDLQALHAVAPCLMTWDDHEVENDYASEWSELMETTPRDFLRRR